MFYRNFGGLFGGLIKGLVKQTRQLAGRFQ